MPEKIFINYRRETDKDAAGRLRDRLESYFSPEGVFIDVDNIRPGSNFVEEISASIAECDIFLSLIGPGWAEVKDREGRRRLENPRDWARIEIEAALRQKKIIIPVLINDTEMPTGSCLPDSLAPLTEINAARLTHERYGADIRGLVEAIRDARAEARARSEQEKRERRWRKADAATEVGQGVNRGARGGASLAPPLISPKPKSGLLAALALLVALTVIGSWYALAPKAPEVTRQAEFEPAKQEATFPAVESSPATPTDSSTNSARSDGGQLKSAELPSSAPLEGAAVTPAAPPVAAGACGKVKLASLSTRTPAPLTAKEVCALQAKDVFKECPSCPEMLVVPAGSFRMGSPESENGRFDNEGPQHLVRIRKAFAVGRFEVTFDEWDACVANGGCGGYRPYHQGWGRGLHPVINVSWNDAQAYVAWLSKKTGKQYRLLSEAEWEYAARAGTTTPFSFGENITTDQVNFNGNFPYLDRAKGVFRGRTVPVGSLPANAFGLYEMHGNVSEWVQDAYHPRYTGAPNDGSPWGGSDEAAERVLRGGSWVNGARYVRSAARYEWDPDARNVFIGFRCTRVLE